MAGNGGGPGRPRQQELELEDEELDLTDEDPEASRGGLVKLGHLQPEVFRRFVEFCLFSAMTGGLVTPQPRGRT